MKGFAELLLQLTHSQWTFCNIHKHHHVHGTLQINHREWVMEGIKNSLTLMLGFCPSLQSTCHTLSKWIAKRWLVLVLPWRRLVIQLKYQFLTFSIPAMIYQRLYCSDGTHKSQVEVVVRQPQLLLQIRIFYYSYVEMPFQKYDWLISQMVGRRDRNNRRSSIKSVSSYYS